MTKKGHQKFLAWKWKFSPKKASVRNLGLGIFFPSPKTRCQNSAYGPYVGLSVCLHVSLLARLTISWSLCSRSVLIGFQLRPIVANVSHRWLILAIDVSVTWDVVVHRQTVTSDSLLSFNEVQPKLDRPIPYTMTPSLQHHTGHSTALRLAPCCPRPLL